MRDKKKLNSTLVAVVETHLHAEKNDLGVGRGGNGKLKCPICKTGKIRYSVASVNGHIWGSCTTEGCVRWIE